MSAGIVNGMDAHVFFHDSASRRSKGRPQSAPASRRTVRNFHAGRKPGRPRGIYQASVRQRERVVATQSFLQRQVDPLLSGLVTKLLLDQPEEPVDFMLTHFKELQTETPETTATPGRRPQTAGRQQQRRVRAADRQYMAKSVTPVLTELLEYVVASKPTNVCESLVQALEQKQAMGYMRIESVTVDPGQVVEKDALAACTPRNRLRQAREMDGALGGGDNNDQHNDVSAATMIQAAHRGRTERTVMGQRRASIAASNIQAIMSSQSAELQELGADNLEPISVLIVELERIFGRPAAMDQWKNSDVLRFLEVLDLKELEADFRLAGLITTGAEGDFAPFGGVSAEQLPGMLANVPPTAIAVIAAARLHLQDQLGKFPIIAKAQAASKKAKSKKARVIVFAIGPGKGGKSTAIHALKGKTGHHIDNPKQTSGFVNTRLPRKHCGDEMDVIFYETGGNPKIRSIWPNYYADTHAFAYFVDAAESDPEQHELGRNLLREAIKHAFVDGKPLAIFANKQDLEGARSAADVAEMLDVKVGDDVAVFECTARPASNDGQLDPRVAEGLKWLLGRVSDRWESLDVRVKDEVRQQDEANQRELEAKKERVFVKVLRKGHPAAGEEPEECMTAEEGVKFLCDEAAAEESDVVCEVAKELNYQKMAMQMVGDMVNPTSRSRAAKSWDEVLNHIKRVKSENDIV